MLYADFKRNVVEQGLVARGDAVVVGVSGGIDSMVLLDLLCRLASPIGFRVSVAHVNHRLRGKASDGDEALVRKTALRYGIPFDVARLRPPKGDNLQDAARALRMRFFEAAATRQGSRAICLAHHQGDQAETILLHLLRGSGLGGLSGMRPVSSLGEARLVRPLLFASRDDIARYAKERGIAFREDATNATVRYRRNSLRHRALPLLREFNPRIEKHLALLAERIAEESDALSLIAEESFEEALVCTRGGAVVLRREDYLPLPRAIRLRLLRLAYIRAAGNAADLNADQLQRMDSIALAASASAEYRLRSPWRFTRDRNFLIIRGAAPPRWRRRAK
jgi:tRNA(Ile)-lysidine synthase